jgi:uncharacterized phage infection (PIP) family protein YhgE
MVSNTILEQLNAAFIDAANKRNQIQSEVNALRDLASQANTSLQRAETQQANAVASNDQKLSEHRELLGYYNGLADKSGLNAIEARIERIASAQRETHRLLGEANRIRQGCYSEAERAKTNLAVAESKLGEAQKEWQRMSEQLERARNER